MVGAGAAVLLSCCCLGAMTLALAADAGATSPMPVIIDTDYGSVFDDSAALALALQSPELDVKLVLTATGDTTARAQVVAKYLAAIGRSDIPVGVGVPNSNRTLTPLYGWATDFPLSKYPGTVYEDGVGAAVDIIRASPVKVTIIAIAPATNFPMLLARGGAAVVANARVAAMSGSIHYGYNNSTTPTNEYNVRICPECMAMLYSAGWEVVSTPLDTCGTATLAGAQFNNWVLHPTPLASVLAQSYLWWTANCDCWFTPGTGNYTDVWFDAVATYIAVSMAPTGVLPRQSFLEYRNLTVEVTAEGYTVESASGSAVTEALFWRDRSAFLTWVGDTIARPTKEAVITF